MNTETPERRLATPAEMEFIKRVHRAALPLLSDRQASIVGIQPVPTNKEGRAQFRVEWSSGQFTRYECPQSEAP